LATALQAADALIVNVALPQLQRDLGGGLARLIRRGASTKRTGALARRGA